MSIIKRGGKTSGELVVGVKVPNIGEPIVAVAGAACVSERLRLERAATRIPEVGGVRQPQGVELAAQGQLGCWSQIQGSIDVAVVHHVVKREAGVLARGSQDLEKSAVPRIVGVPSPLPYE